MTLRQEVEVHEIHAESDYDEDDEGPVAPGSQDGSLSQLLISRNRKEPFENLPRPSSHPSVPQHEIPADDYDENGDGQSREVKQPFGNLPRLHPSVPRRHQEPDDSEYRKQEPWKKKVVEDFFSSDFFLVIFRWVRRHDSRRGVWVFNMAAYLDPHEKAITFQALRRCLESAGPCGLSGESGGSEGLASATTDNRPMSIDVYRAPAPGPSAPKPPGQPAIGGRLV